MDSSRLITAALREAAPGVVAGLERDSALLAIAGRTSAIQITGVDDAIARGQAYEAAGFYSYHVAEHHFTPLGMASSPAVYLSAVAQRSKRLRFGPMVFCLPLYHPLRIAEEICMLDQMSGGRFDLGVGRGISPLESRSYGESPEKEVTQEVYVESLAILKKAMEGGKFSHAGKHRSVEDVEMTIGPAQKPHPPLWMGVQTVANAEFAARNGMSMLSLLSAPQLRDKVERHREVWRATHGASTAPGKQGVGLFIVVAETEGKAMVREDGTVVAHADGRLDWAMSAFLGRDVEERYGRTEFLAISLAAAFLGGLLWSLRIHFSGGGAGALIGASGAVVAVTLGITFWASRQNRRLSSCPARCFSLAMRRSRRPCIRRRASARAATRALRSPAARASLTVGPGFGQKSTTYRASSFRR